VNPYRLKLLVFGLVGVAGTAVAGVLVFAPAALGEALPALRAVTEMVAPLWVGALVGVVGLVAAWHVGRGGRDDGDGRPQHDQRHHEERSEAGTHSLDGQGAVRGSIVRWLTPERL